MPTRVESLRSKLARIASQFDESTPTAAERAFHILRIAIGEVVLEPRETLPEKELATALGCSKTPVREALIRLATEGLVLTLPRSGTFVAPIVPDDLFEAMIIREALETVAVRLAARRVGSHGKFALREAMRRQREALDTDDVAAFHRADDDLHRTIVEISGLPRLLVMLDTVRLTLNRVRHLATPIPGRAAVLMAQHQAIVDAVLSNDVEAAAFAMRVHLDALMPFVESLLRDRPDLFALPRPAAQRRQTPGPTTPVHGQTRDGQPPSAGNFASKAPR